MADVILADGKLTPRAIVSQVTLDWACGTDENDFELTIDDPDAPEIERGWYFWLDGSDVGGRIIDRRVTVSGGVSTAMWIGQSWTGMLAAKILQPDANQDYLTVSGKLPDILKSLLKRIGLDSVFTVDSSDASTLSNWMFRNPRYVDAYTGFRNLLASCGRRLDFQAKDNRILLGITPVGIIDNTIDSDLVDFKAETNCRAVNHLIGLGSQELKDRLVVNYFADAAGAVSQTQTLIGVDEVCATYDYSNADLSTLQSETKKHLQELQTGGSVEVTLSDEVGDGLHVDDKIVATDQASGVNVTAVVTKQIVKIDSGILTSTFEVGLPVQSAKSVADGAKSGMMTDGERSKLASVERGANAYALPKASTDVLGGVRVDGSTIVSVDGVISAHVNGGSGSTGKVVFPIGYVVMNTTGVDPAVDFGGTWRQLPSLGCSMFERIG